MTRRYRFGLDEERSVDVGRRSLCAGSRAASWFTATSPFVVMQVFG